MTVSSTTARQTYIGDGSLATYSYNFRIFDAADLVLVKRNTSTGAETLLALTTDYTVTGAGGYNGGTFTLLAGVLPSGYDLAAFRELDLLQATDLRNQGSYLAEVQERALDRLMMISQQAQDQINRSIRLPDSEAGGSSLKLPAKEIRKLMGLYFDANGDPIPGAPASAAVSATMRAVVASASLASARRAIGATLGIDACADHGASPSNGAADNITAINAAIAAAIADGSKCVFFSVPGQYDAGALTNVDQVVLHGNGAHFNPALASYKINQIGAVAGKKGTKYAIYGGIPRHTGYSVSAMTRSGSTVTVTVPSNANLRVGAYVTIQGAVETDYNGTWPVATLVGGTQFTFSIGGATPTTPATGTITGYWWELLDDANHTPTGFAYCTTPDVNTLRVYYTDQAKKISHLIVAPDDALAPHGVVVGGDVGTTYANLMAFCPLACSLNGGGGGAGIPALVKVPPLLTSALSVSNGGTAIRRLNHPTVDANDVPLVTVKSPAGGQSLPKLVQLQWGQTYVDIIAVGPLAGFVSWGGAAFGQALSDNVAVPTFTWTAGTGTLRVEHGDTFSDGLPPMVTSHGGVYVVQTVNVTTSYFEVSFYDWTGAKVTGAANANMAFTYAKTRSLVPVVWPDDMEVTVRRGLVPVRVDDYFRVAGNNFWVSALMEAI